MSVTTKDVGQGYRANTFQTGFTRFVEPQACNSMPSHFRSRFVTATVTRFVFTVTCFVTVGGAGGIMTAGGAFAATGEAAGVEDVIPEDEHPFTKIRRQNVTMNTKVLMRQA